MSEDAIILLVFTGIFFLLFIPILFAVLNWILKTINQHWPSAFMGRVLAGFQKIEGLRLGGKGKDADKDTHFGPGTDIAILILLLAVAAGVVMIAMYALKSCGR
jgi:hypothetical protein